MDTQDKDQAKSPIKLAEEVVAETATLMQDSGELEFGIRSEEHTV